ncbi:unnamed protein product, partial [Mesorhabditis belari]|uniref:Uncharacterized protein n=1 Tax=Mesorhabditis belari TaxID=2138241 RepID=A0AAF3EYJ7_9BILA
MLKVAESSGNEVVEELLKLPRIVDQNKIIRKDQDVKKRTSERTFDCEKCGGPKSRLTTEVDGVFNCLSGQEKDNKFVNYKKRVLLNRTEECCKDEVTRRDTRTVEESMRMDSPRELDHDLYDKVSYLNLMDDYRKEDTRKRNDRMDSLRRVRDEV